MRRPRQVGEAAAWDAVDRLLNRFEYPDEIGGGGTELGAGGGGMAHVLIVSDSEPQEIQDKADFVVPSSNSSTMLQDIFTALEAAQGNNGSWSIWMAGVFDLDSDVTAPSRSWIRGLGYTLVGGSA